MSDKRQDGMPSSPAERYLRRLLAARSGILGVYFDDGEAFGQEGDIKIDFMRDEVTSIDANLRELGRRRALRDLSDSAMLDWIEKIAKQHKIEIARSILGSGFEIGEWPTMLVTVRSGTLRDVIQAAMARKDRT